MVFPLTVLSEVPVSTIPQTDAVLVVDVFLLAIDKL